MRKQFTGKYEAVTGLENLFSAWQEFISGKRKKRDVQQFSLRLTDNLVQLHSELADFTYEHGGYFAFHISDPKPRHIHKAAPRDRVLHHAVYRQLYPFFDRTFIADSFSCRIDKGVHKAMDRFREFGRKVSKNHTRTAWVLKLDIKKFFASIDHEVLLGILNSYINSVIVSEAKQFQEIAASPSAPRNDVIWLLERVIRSFEVQHGKGLPLGNLTSQLFCNIYLNEFDQFVKHKLKAQYYIRYADDFVLLSDDREWLMGQINNISEFLAKRLRLSLHPDKVYIKTLASGIDFLGWVHFPHYRVLREITKKRAFRRIYENPKGETLQSYLGLLKHGNTYQLQQEMLNNYGLWRATGE